jgi:hypothetical protein
MHGDVSSRQAGGKTGAVNVLSFAERAWQSGFESRVKETVFLGKWFASNVVGGVGAK